MKYTRKPENLTTGSSLGNFLLFARFDPETNLEGLWHSLDNKFYCGRWKIEIYSNERLIPVETYFEPLSQATRYESHLKKLTILKRAFLPYARIENFDKYKNHLLKFFYALEFKNDSDETLNITVVHEITLPAVDSNFFTKQPPSEEKDKRFKLGKNGEVIEIESINSNERRRFLVSNFKFEKMYFDGRKIKTMQTLKLETREKIEVVFLYSLDENVDWDDLINLYYEVCELSNAELKEVLDKTYIFTPERLINDGLQWAKVNMCRVEHLYKTGFAFTNDPPQDIVVMRDLAWFVLGSDYVMPKFSHKMIEFALKYGIYPNGKVTEYVHANEPEPKLHDYNLNINDDTPLLIWALYHHANLCNLSELSQNYDKVKKIADYISTQVKDGLVFSSADGFGVYGITGWRNIIENYNLSGYVTEINSECIYSFEIASKIADFLCNKQDAMKYKIYAENLRENFYKKLISKRTGLPVLNISRDGIEHDDITGDLIFPLLFEVVDDEVGRRISERLIQSDIWTEFGARTVSKLEKSYDPDFGFQLMGGIWPNLTVWIGYGVRKFSPEKVSEAFVNVYKLIGAKNPSDFQNLVPGQFAERFHGENFKSKGMTLSPWMPPTYIWLAVEGLWGFSFEFEKIKVKPSIPSGWKWLGVKNLPYRNFMIDAFIWDGKLYIFGIEKSKIEFDGDIIEIEKLSDEVSLTGDGRVYHIMFRVVGEDERYVFIASDVGFKGEINMGDKIFEVKLGPGEGMILRL